MNKRYQAALVAAKVKLVEAQLGLLAVQLYSVDGRTEDFCACSEALSKVLAQFDAVIGKGSRATS